MRLSKLVQRRDKLGDFNTIEDLLELDGFGLKILEKFCNSIIQSDIKEISNGSNAEQELALNSRNKKDAFVTPPLLEEVRNRIKSIVSFQMDLNYFSWAKITYAPNEQVHGKFQIEDWHCHKIEQFEKKPTLSTMSSFLVQLTDYIPHADAYVIESMPMVNTTQGGAAQIIVNIQKAQFYSMLCALMSSRKSLKLPEDDSKEVFYDNVYFLKSFLTSRFYKYLIGNEKVATEQIIELIFQYNAIFNHHQEMPKLESVDISKELIEIYQSSKPVQKEYLGNSLLVGLSFMKLCIQKCPKCIGMLRVRNSP